MDEPLVLCRAFSGRAPQVCHVSASDRLEQALWGRWEESRAAWPAVALEAEAFAGHLGGCLEEGDDPQQFLSEIPASDLYLACACALGVPAALAAFDRDFLQKVPAMLARIDPSPAFADEVQQILRERLLMGRAGDVPRIAQFLGQGTLLGWLRIAAARTARDLLRGRHERPREDISALAANALPVGRGPEADYLKARYQPEFKEALRAAFAALPPEQRDILRWQFIEGLTGDKIAERLGVSRRTVMRRLAEAREALFKETRRRMRERLHLSDSEFQSLMGVVRSGLDLSISMFLGE